MISPPAIFNEAEVPDYTLPPLQSRRSMIGGLESSVYGAIPDMAMDLAITKIESGRLQGSPAVIREQWQVEISNGASTVRFDLAVFLPGEADKPVPLFLGLNFEGNATVHPDPALAMEYPAVRGSRASRWPIPMMVERGYGLATLHCHDLAPDDPVRWKEGLASLWVGRETANPPGALSVWARGLSLARQSLADNERVDSNRIAVIGHSRLGKAALWAGALDEAFALVISNESGCGGAALSRRRFGERLVHINTTFPHWFSPAFADYNERESDLPVDQHQLLASIAPRALYVASAEGDQWADPRGEYLSLKAASPAWGQDLFDDSPPVGQTHVAGSLGYHCRSGPHDLTREDWGHFLDFADTALPDSSGPAGAADA